MTSRLTTQPTSRTCHDESHALGTAQADWTGRAAPRTSSDTIAPSVRRRDERRSGYGYESAAGGRCARCGTRRAVFHAEAEAAARAAEDLFGVPRLVRRTTEGTSMGATRRSRRNRGPHRNQPASPRLLARIQARETTKTATIGLLNFR